MKVLTYLIKFINCCPFWYNEKKYVQLLLESSFSAIVNNFLFVLFCSSCFVLFCSVSLLLLCCVLLFSLLILCFLLLLLLFCFASINALNDKCYQKHLPACPDRDGGKG